MTLSLSQLASRSVDSSLGATSIRHGANMLVMLIFASLGEPSSVRTCMDSSTVRKRDRQNIPSDRFGSVAACRHHIRRAAASGRKAVCRNPRRLAQQQETSAPTAPEIQVVERLA